MPGNTAFERVSAATSVAAGHAERVDRGDANVEIRRQCRRSAGSGAAAGSAVSAVSTHSTAKPWSFDGPGIVGSIFSCRGKLAGAAGGSAGVTKEGVTDLTAKARSLRRSPGKNRRAPDGGENRDLIF